jgi:hypothetical protein
MSVSLQQTTLQSLNVIFQGVIESLPDETESRLIEIAQSAKDLERFGFRIRAAVALEIIGRLERKGMKRAEVNKVLSGIAKDAEIELSTLKEDCRVATAFPEVLTDGVVLEREYYLRALSAPDPQSALDYAVQQKAEGKGFSTRDMREYVGWLNSGEAKEAIESEHWAKVLFTNEGWQALQEAMKYRDKGTSDVINDLLLEWLEWHRGKRK